MGSSRSELELPRYDRTELQMRVRCAGDRLGIFKMDLQCLARRGYAALGTMVHEELALHAILNGLRPPHLHKHVRIAASPSLLQALHTAQCVEAITTTEAGKRPECMPLTQCRSAADSRNDCIMLQHGDFMPLTDGWTFCAGRLVQLAGQYVDCLLDNAPVRALIDTGPTVSLLRNGVLKPALTIYTVASSRLGVEANRIKQVLLGGSVLVPEFFVGQIVKSCVLGLDFLKKCGAVVFFYQPGFYEAHLGRLNYWGRPREGKL